MVSSCLILFIAVLTTGEDFAYLCVAWFLWLFNYWTVSSVNSMTLLMKHSRRCNLAYWLFWDEGSGETKVSEKTVWSCTFLPVASHKNSFEKYAFPERRQEDNSYQLKDSIRGNSEQGLLHWFLPLYLPSPQFTTSGSLKCFPLSFHFYKIYCLLLKMQYKSEF